jgi:hypothetical protein
LYLNAQAILQPLRSEMTVAPFAAGMAVVCRLPAKHPRHVTETEKLVANYTRVRTQTISVNAANTALDKLCRRQALMQTRF